MNHFEGLHRGDPAFAISRPASKKRQVQSVNVAGARIRSDAGGIVPWHGGVPFFGDPSMIASGSR